MYIKFDHIFRFPLNSKENTKSGVNTCILCTYCRSSWVIYYMHIIMNAIICVYYTGMLRILCAYMQIGFCYEGSLYL